MINYNLQSIINLSLVEHSAILPNANNLYLFTCILQSFTGLGTEDQWSS